MNAGAFHKSVKQKNPQILKAKYSNEFWAVFLKLYGVYDLARIDDGPACEKARSRWTCVSAATHAYRRVGGKCWPETGTRSTGIGRTSRPRSGQHFPPNASPRLRIKFSRTLHGPSAWNVLPEDISMHIRLHIVFRRLQFKTCYFSYTGSI